MGHVSGTMQAVGVMPDGEGKNPPQTPFAKDAECCATSGTAKGAVYDGGGAENEFK